MKISGGLQGLLTFLVDLERQGITFSLHRYSDDAITVFFTPVAVRVEVAFFTDHFEFSYFRGNEDVETDPKILLDLIDKHWGN